jgi:deoxyribose-phosphate aldolase
MFNQALLSQLDIAAMIDLSAVRVDSSDEKVQTAVLCARQYNFYLVTVLPSQTKRTKELLSAENSPKLGGNVGFPSGGQTTSIKVQETQELVRLGVDEIDMVMDVAAHLSGRYQDIYRDIASVVEAAGGRPVKVILECHYLNNDQIRTACDQAINAGAAFVKTGTGWAPTGATLENIALIKNHVGDAIQIKASGGVRGLETIHAMYYLGARRFGISARHAAMIFESSTLQTQIECRETESRHL